MPSVSNNFELPPPKILTLESVLCPIRMPLAFPEPETLGLLPTNQARDMDVGDLNGLLEAGLL